MIRVLGSSVFFWGVMLLFVVETMWIAFSAAYPMAFDENYHFGIIKLYADHLSPFWQSQPANSDAFGVVYRDTSYMYQYLMSFPYNLVAWFTDSQTIQVVYLRLLNIGLFASGIYIFRKVLSKTGASGAVINSCVLVFVLVPVVPLLAAQINYDNLFIPLVGLSLLLTIRVARGVKDRKDSVLFDTVSLLTLCLFICIVKYAFIPFFIAIILYLFVIRVIDYKTIQVIRHEIARGIYKFKQPAGVILLILLIFSSILFAERYFVNTYIYHTPVPDCSAVLSEKSCSQYGPWSRDNYLAQNKPAGNYNPMKFNVEWFEGMWKRLYFSLGGPDTGYQTRKPMPIPYQSSIIVATIGFILALIYSPKIWRKYDHRVLNLFVGVSGLYIVILWLNQYQAYIKTGQPVAINGRYLLPIMMLLMLIMVLGYNELLNKRNYMKVALLSGFIFCMLYGGGAMTFVIRSNNSWYWNNGPLNSINNSLQNNIGPLIIGNKQQ